MEKTIFRNNKESGNVLFLILIATALFAALTFVAINSTRLGEKKHGETGIVNISSLNQYPANLRMALVRMTTSGMSAADAEFNLPSEFGTLSANRFGVFHPNGGGATYHTAAPQIMVSGEQGRWYFNAEFEIDDIGTDEAGTFNGNDIIAFLPGIQPGLCEELNEKLGLTTAVPETNVDVSAQYMAMMDNNYMPPAGEVVLGVAGANGTDILSGQPTACFRNNGGDYVYYHVLTER